jgi:hypothetical protein
VGGSRQRQRRSSSASESTTAPGGRGDSRRVLSISPIYPTMVTPSPPISPGLSASAGCPVPERGRPDLDKQPIGTGAPLRSNIAGVELRTGYVRWHRSGQSPWARPIVGGCRPSSRRPGVCLASCHCITTTCIGSRAGNTLVCRLRRSPWLSRSTRRWISRCQVLHGDGWPVASRACTMHRPRFTMTVRSAACN